MQTRVYAQKFDFPEKKDERVMSWVLPLALMLGAAMNILHEEIPVPLFALELSMGFSLGSIMFLLVDLTPMSDAGFYIGQERPPLADMLVVILTWGALLSGCLLMGSLVMLSGELSTFTAIFFICTLAGLKLLIPSMCWNVRMFYRKVRR